MKPRKLRIPTGGKPLPAATRLKQLPAESRARIFELFSNKSDADIIKEIELDFGIKCSASSLFSFRQWQFHQQRLENYNMMLEQFQRFYEQAKPNATREQVRNAGIAFFLAETTANNDRKGFSDIAHLSVSEESAKMKAQHDERKIGVAERRVSLLEKKAAQADAAAKVVSGKLTPEEKVLKMKAIFGL